MKTALLLAVCAGAALATDYRIAPAEGFSFRLQVEKTGLLRGKKHVFDFPRYRAEVAYDPSSPLTATINFTIETASIHCLDEWVSAKDRDKIQKYAEHDMLAVDRFPMIAFQSTRIMADGPGRFHVQGLLTIRNVAKPVDISVRLLAGEVEGQASVKLSDYGLKPASAALGAIGTKDEMRVIFRLKMRV